MPNQQLKVARAADHPSLWECKYASGWSERGAFTGILA